MLFRSFFTPEFWYMTLLTLPAIIIGLTVHEFAHAFASTKLGDPTPRMTGRYTLNPLKHIDWMGFLFLILAGFGYAKPVMINPSYFKNRKAGEIIVSLAGVFTNLVVAFVFSLILYVTVVFAGWTDGTYQLIMQLIIRINLGLMIFNLIPVPPLDGWHVLKMFLKIKNIRAVWAIERYGFLLPLVLVALIFFGILPIGEWVSYIFQSFIRFWAMIFGIALV